MLVIGVISLAFCLSLSHFALRVTILNRYRPIGTNLHVNIIVTVRVYSKDSLSCELVEFCRGLKSSQLLSPHVKTPCSSLPFGFTQSPQICSPRILVIASTKYWQLLQILSMGQLTRAISAHTTLLPSKAIGTTKLLTKRDKFIEVRRHRTTLVTTYFWGYFRFFLLFFRRFRPSDAPASHRPLMSSLAVRILSQDTALPPIRQGFGRTYAAELGVISSGVDMAGLPLYTAGACFFRRRFSLVKQSASGGLARLRRVNFRGDLPGRRFCQWRKKWCISSVAARLKATRK